MRGTVRKGAFNQTTCLRGLLGAGLLAASLSPQALAQNADDEELIAPQSLDFITEVTVASGYNSNSRLDFNAAAPRVGSYFTAIEPVIGVTYQGDRTSANVVYRPIGIWFEELDEAEVRHNLSGSASFALVPETIFFTAGANILNVIGIRGVSGVRTDYNFSPDRLTVQSYSTGIHLEGATLGPIKATGDYTFGFVDSGNSISSEGLPLGFGSSFIHNADMDLEFDLGSRVLFASAILTGQIVDRDEFSTFRQGTALGEVGARVFQNISVVGQAGTFQATATDLGSEGFYWRGGIQVEGRWLELRALAGRRGDDTVFEGDLKVELSRTFSLNGVYRDDIMTNQGGFLAGALSGSVGPGVGNAGFDIQNQVIRNRQARAGFSYSDDIGTLTIDGTYGIRDNLNVDEGRPGSVTSFGIGGSYDRKFSSGLRVGVGVNYLFFEDELPEGEVVESRPGNTRVNASISYPISQTLTIAAEYNWVNRNFSAVFTNVPEHLTFLSVQGVF